ncbi:beta-N-acetylhexosaminidase [Pseudozobellia sp. WGM2]|uniref:beta-N-acetylhexosaminidase n=1 Tax=Pseudozobellia sp. WGM2 TaxID=2787625 RepID=UPI001ADF6A2A|nr:beta-N-acetylhexosaminidase [Pseudozobellia sp. WGM2]
MIASTMKGQITANIFFLGIITLLTAACNPEVRQEKADATLSIIPQPSAVRAYEGFFVLDSLTQVVFHSKEQRKATDWFNKELQSLARWSCHTGTSAKENNSILLIQDDSLANEAYQLDIGEDRITIKASSESGYFYAFQTILQLAPVLDGKDSPSKLKIQQATISDEPRFKWRGALIDISRHFFGPQSIKQLIDQMAAHKMNRLHLHLTDDTGWRIEIKEYPKLIEIGSLGDRTNPNGPSMYITEKEAREITAYANERHVMIIPEVDIPGHSGAIERAYPEFSGGNNTLNIANEDAVKMIETVILRLSDLFHTRYVHFGGDEVRHHNWEGRPEMLAKMKRLKLKDQREFEGWFDRRMADFIVESGLNPIAWDEASDFGINKGTTLQWWRGEYPEVLYSAAKEGYDIILSPVDFLYLDYPSNLEEAGANWEGLHNGPNSMEAIYKWNPIPETFSDIMAARILGVEAGIWTEFIDNQKRLEYMTYPRLFAVAEKGWTAKNNIDWESFQERLLKQYEKLQIQGINFRIPDIGTEERKKRQPEAFDGPIAE